MRSASDPAQIAALEGRYEGPKQWLRLVQL